MFHVDGIGDMFEVSGFVRVTGLRDELVEVSTSTGLHKAFIPGERTADIHIVLSRVKQ